MATKAAILESMGERSLLLPELIARGLEAHDRLKYYLTLLQTAYTYAQSPSGPVPDLRGERQAAGVSDESLDTVIGASRMVTPATMYLPNAAALVDRIFLDVRQMLEPVMTSAAMHGELTERCAVYTRRLDEHVAHAPTCVEDQLPATAV